MIVVLVVLYKWYHYILGSINYLVMHIYTRRCLSHTDDVLLRFCHDGCALRCPLTKAETRDVLLVITFLISQWLSINGFNLKIWTLNLTFSSISDKTSLRQFKEANIFYRLMLSSGISVPWMWRVKRLHILTCILCITAIASSFYHSRYILQLFYSSITTLQESIYPINYDVCFYL